jgi:hypothetical protein
LPFTVSPSSLSLLVALTWVANTQTGEEEETPEDMEARQIVNKLLFDSVNEELWVMSLAGGQAVTAGFSESQQPPRVAEAINRYVWGVSLLRFSVKHCRIALTRCSV